MKIGISLGRSGLGIGLRESGPGARIGLGQGWVGQGWVGLGGMGGDRAWGWGWGWGWAWAWGWGWGWGSNILSLWRNWMP